MNSSIGKPDPVAMRQLLDYLARKKRERLLKAQAQKSQDQKSRPTAAPQN